DAALGLVLDPSGGQHEQSRADYLDVGDGEGIWVLGLGQGRAVGAYQGGGDLYHASFSLACLAISRHELAVGVTCGSGTELGAATELEGALTSGMSSGLGIGG